jgi:siroheme synthase
LTGARPRRCSAGQLTRTCAELIAAGRPADEPAAIVQWAWTPERRTVVGTLSDLATLAEAANIGPPATLVVGAVAALAGSIEGSRPVQSRPASRQAP